MEAATAVTANGAANATLSPEDKARYEAARKELIQALQKKRLVDRQLAQLEVQIYNFEGSYLSETAQHSGGNIIQGFDGYLKTQSVGRRRHEPTDADRVFSNSSLSYQKSLELLSEGGDDPDTFGPLSSTLSNGANTTSRGPTPGLTSIVLPPPTSTTTPTATAHPQRLHHDGQGPTPQQLTAAMQKKMRDKEYQRRKRASAAREKERNAQLAAQAAAQAQAQAQAQTAADGGAQDGMGGGEGEGSGAGDSASVSAVSTARGRMSKKPRQADDD